MTEFDQSPSPKLARDVVAVGRKHSKAAFPNPGREGCPSRDSLRAMARRARHLTLSELPLSHVVRCSPCFQDYTHFRHISAVVRGVQITAASLLVVALALVATRFVWNHPGTDRPTISLQQSSPPSLVATKQPPPVIAPVSIQIDLASLSPTRGDDINHNAPKPIRLPRKWVRVTLFLPFGMEAGEYIIRLQSPSGLVVVERNAVGHLKGGTTSLETDIDLSNVSRGSLTLMIRPPGLSWRRFLVVVD